MTTTKKTTQKKTSTRPKAKTTGKLDKANKTVQTQKVIVRRELKYVYPKGCTDPLERKAFRRKVRNKIESYQKQIRKLRGDERKAKKAELEKYESEVKA